MLIDLDSQAKIPPLCNKHCTTMKQHELYEHYLPYTTTSSIIALNGPKWSGYLRIQYTLGSH